ncbi:receptor-type tyrosine-protein phosphatase kappa-like [Ptychodera flava]|uniref:receptor-type tyrosine-protein phosphatase kappa-like n=1 Tax=Ptychodera flava TaxID=63121 RepID=UPI00396A81C7
MYWETDNESTSRIQKEVTENLKDVNAFLITNLTYKVSYSVQVGAHTTPGLGELSDMISVTTTEVVPAKPSSIDVLHTQNTELKLTWSAPFPFSGNIINYWISYRSIESVFEDTQQQFQSFLVEGNSDVYTFKDLSPGTMYEIRVNASTAKGFGEAAAILATTSFAVDIGKTLPVTDKMKKDIQLFGTSTEVLVPSLSEDSGISKDTTLIDYIIVLEYGQSSISSKRRGKRYIDTSRLGEYNETGLPFYITALLPLNGLPKTFIIGDGGVYGGYTNVHLTIGRQYGVYYGLRSEIQGEPFYYLLETPSIHFTAGCTETACHCSTTAAIIVSVIAVVLILCLVIFVVFLFRRLSSAKGSNEEKGNFGGIKKIEESEMCQLQPKVTKDMKQDYEDPDHGHQYACVDVSTQRSTQLTSAARPRQSESNDEENVYTGLVKELQSESEYASLSVLRITDTTIPVKDIRQKFTKLLEKHKKNMQTYLEEEWKALNESSYKPKDQQCKTGRLPKNVKKNRYPDILPIDDHRPKLVPIKPDGSSSLTDYINASFVDTCTKKKAFLVTHMPLPHTLVDFWRMVYDHKSRLIVMLNDQVNTDGDNCHYWPNEYEIKHCGQYELELVCVKRVGDVVERSFTLSKGNESILIYQWQVLRWIESHNSGSLAQNIAGLMNMITQIKQQTGDGPLTVHCINGIGRSGVFCAAVSASERMKIDQMVDVSEAVKTLRNNRPNMVQTMEEYKLCYEVIMQWSDATLQAYENVEA